jgi:poly(A) polymerase
MSNRKQAIKIIHKLRDAGFEAFLAGGCVRDMHLRRTPKDYDVATSAKPEDVIDIFPRTLKVGAKFGVVIVLSDGKQTEVATFRAESGYEDGRHPTQIHFTGIKQDGARRDFTINAMFYDPAAKETIDFFEGQMDLITRTLRTVGSADERFSEDYLRMLRAIRFACQLDFMIEGQTFDAIKKHADQIIKISGERINLELTQIFENAARTRGVRLLFESGLLDAIFGKDFAGSQKDVLDALLHLKSKTCAAAVISCLFKNIETKNALRKIEILKLSRGQLKTIRFLLDNRGVLLDYDMPLWQLKTLLAEPDFDELYQLEKAAARSLAEPTVNIGALLRLSRRIRKLGDVECQPKPFLNGNELMELTELKGPKLGKLAKELYHAQLNEEIKTRKAAVKWVKQKMEQKA